jgi:crotonobetainyl-CoA:carnitine CoA-transferase CaiB-like acyl-CoA transferase
MTAPLAGVRVVEVAGWMAAPGATAIMADMGADVIKVEPLTGDPMRGATRQPDPDAGGARVDPGFQMDNRGKRGIAVAVNTDGGADLVRRLVANADVFVTNLLPGRQQRYGLDAATLQGQNPRLVHATLSGYGLEGPDTQRPGYDLTAFFGRGAILDAMTEADATTPPRLRPAQGDHTAALSLLASILAALRLAEATGEGQVVEANLLATATWTMSTDLAATLVDGQPPTSGRRSRPHALHGAFRCADGRWLVLFMPEPRWWEPFCEAVGHPEWATDERFADIRARRQHMGELTDLLDEAIAAKPLEEWARIFDGYRFIWGPASTLPELASDPQAESLHLYREVSDPDAGDFRTVAAPVHVEGADITPRGPAPAVGAHTHDVLTELGLSDDDVRGLAADGVVGTA